jgi:hypothetical protein
MGAAASSMGGPGSPGGDQGKIVLTPAQQQQLDVVSNLFQLLLSKNNIVDLASLMETEGEHCSNLIITLSAQLDKEFQRLRLKAPRGEVAEVGFLSEDQYRKIQKKETRVYMCTQIARFLLQFVILVSALTASISVMDGLPDIQPRIELYEPVDAEKYAKEEINPRILSSLTDARLLKEVRATGFPAQEVYDLFGKYYIHYRGLIYTNGGSERSSKVFNIQINYVRSSTCADVSGTGSMGSIGVPGAPSYPGQSSTGSRGYSSWLTPQEEFEKQIATATAKATSEQASKSAQLEEDKKRALEQAQIERYKSQGIMLLNELSVKANSFKNKIDMIEDSINDSTIKTLIRNATTTYSSTQPTSSNSSPKATLYRAINKRFPDAFSSYRKIAAAIDNFESELNKRFGITESSMKSAFDMLNESKRSVDFIGNELDAIISILNTQKSSIPSEGGAGEYLHIILSPLSESRSSNTSNNAYRSQPQPSRPNSGYPSYTPSQPFQLPQQPSLPQQSPPQPQFGGASLEFIMDYAGNTYDKDYYCKMGGRVSKDQRSMTLAKRLEEIFKTTNTSLLEIVNKAGSSTSARNTKDFTGFSFASDSINQLTGYFKRVLSKSATEIQSPAAQRAYLLLNQIKDEKTADNKAVKKIYMKVCDDPWGSKHFNSIPAYGLLGALYENVLGQQDSAPDISKTGLKTINYTSDAGDKLWSKEFDYSALYSDLGQYCISGTGIPLNSKAASIVKTAYNELKRLYGVQLEKVINYMKEIFVVDREFITTLSSSALAAADYQTAETVLRLNPRFLQSDANGVLLEIMQRARKDLDTHYTTVEKTYQKALEDLKNAQVGGNQRTRKHRRARNRQTTYRKH